MAQTQEIAGFTVFLPIDTDEPDRIYPALRLATLHGKRIGFLSNSKDNVDYLFADIQAYLQKTYAIRSAVHRRKAHFAVQAPRAMLEDLHQQCDAVIVAAGA
jgi:hypothetical protein